jgi:hypothetical protein
MQKVDRNRNRLHFFLLMDALIAAVYVAHPSCLLRRPNVKGLAS